MHTGGSQCVVSWYVCVYVCERERERVESEGREREREREHGGLLIN